MVKIYYKRIKRGQMTLDDVPALWYDKVKAMLDADNASIR